MNWLVWQMVIQMPYNPNANMTDDQLGRLDEIAHLYSMSRSIKCFSIIDIFLVTLYALSYLAILLLLPLPIFGYWGAKKYQPHLVMVYAFYLFVFAICGRCVLLYYSETFIQQVLMIMVICIEIFILKITITFINEIRNLTDEDKLLLEMGPVPIGGVFF